MWFCDSKYLTLFEAMSDNSISSDSLHSITQFKTKQTNIVDWQRRKTWIFCRLCHTWWTVVSKFYWDRGFHSWEGWVSKWIKKVYKSTSQPSDCSLCSAALSSAKCHEVFLFSSLFFRQMSWRQGTKRAELITALLPRSASLNSVWLPNELTKNPIHHP